MSTRFVTPSTIISLSLFAFFSLFTNLISAAQLEAATAERLAAKAAAGENIRVIIQLKGAAVALSANKAARISMQNAIAARQDGLLARHPNLVRSVKRYRQTPFVALETNALGLDSLRNDADVESIEEDLPLRLNLTQTPAITRADLAWASGYRGAGQTVAILDTGVDAAHPFFGGKVVSEACFSAGGSGSSSLCPNGQTQQSGAGAAAPCSDNSLGCYHGTHVAGIAAGKSGVLSGGAGMAPDAKLIAVQVFTRY